MKIDLTQKVLTVQGKPFQVPTEDGKSLKNWDCDLKEVIVGALIGAIPQDGQMSVPDKLKVYRLAKRVEQANGSMSMEAEEIALVKERVARVYAGNHLFGAVADLLEGEATPPPAQPPPAAP